MKVQEDFQEKIITGEVFNEKFKIKTTPLIIKGRLFDSTIDAREWSGSTPFIQVEEGGDLGSDNKVIMPINNISYILVKKGGKVTFCQIDITNSEGDSSSPIIIKEGGVVYGGIHILSKNSTYMTAVDYFGPAKLFAETDKVRIAADDSGSSSSIESGENSVSSSISDSSSSNTNIINNISSEGNNLSSPVVGSSLESRSSDSQIPPATNHSTITNIVEDISALSLNANNFSSEQVSTIGETNSTNSSESLN